ncbi:MAG: hypothetical protein LUG50_12220 [Planctomycetaceae bacterium]|nr:hypothetical protein [Planctomycetaceae bacterium]
MAFDHPHQLTLKRRRTTAGSCFSDLPIVRDRRGRIIYKWDAYYSDCDDPRDQQKRDVWELAEVLNSERRRTAEARETNTEARQRRLDAIHIAPTVKGHYHPTDDVEDNGDALTATTADYASSMTAT